jgi:hypothetical protein
LERRVASEVTVSRRFVIASGRFSLQRCVTPTTIADTGAHAVMHTTTFRLFEQRRSARARVHFPARYASGTMTLEGHVTDLSAEGLFFASDFLDALGELARVWVVLPSRPEPLELRGEVRWVNDGAHVSGMGLRLVEVGWEERQLLAALAPRGDLAGDVSSPAPTGNA